MCSLSALLYRAIRWLVRFFYPVMEVTGTEHLSDEPVIYVANHAKMNGPIACELYLPGQHRTWCAGEMMHLKEVPDYAFQDFWAQKPWYNRWLFRLLSYLMAPLSVVVFNNADTIGVYHDGRILSTFKETVQQLQQGRSIVIFPEHDQPYNHILSRFQDRFIDVAKLYYKRTGKEVLFVPLYIAPALKTMALGEGVRFDAQHPMDEERRRICEAMMASITDMACRLPHHRVVTYRNIPKRQQPCNRPKESTHEKTCC